MTINQTMPPIISVPTGMSDTPQVSISSSADFPEKQSECKTAPAISCSLKRKRPPSIEIPNVLRELRGVSSRDRSPLDGADCSGGFGVGVFSTKGKKKFMEDSHRIISCSIDKKGFFGVYDGHGGRKAADFVAQNLHKNIYEMLESCTVKEEGIKAGYLKTDQEFLKQGLGSGACCVTALIEGKEIILSNIGDCRAVLCRGGVAEALTEDHRAGREGERKRIEDKGGYVEFHRGAWRVHGILSVSRSIGDAHLKEWVVAEPDSRTLHLTEDMEYLVLASDGLWEEVGNQEAVDIVMRSCLIKKKEVVPTYSEFDDYVKVSSPPSKLRRVSLLTQNRRTAWSSNYKSENENENENKATARKAQTKLSLDQSNMMRVLSPGQENGGGYKKVRTLDGLADACKELVNLAVARGSLDDITVMIINLNSFKS